MPRKAHRSQVILPAGGVLVIQPDHQLGPAREPGGPAGVVLAKPDVIGHVIGVSGDAPHAEIPIAGHAGQGADRHRKDASGTGDPERIAVKHVRIAGNVFAAVGNLGH